MKKTWTLITAIIVLLGMVSMSGCGVIAKTTEKATENIVETIEETSKATETEVAATPAPGKGYQLVEQFVAKIQSGDTSDIMDMVYVKDATFVSADAIVWAVERNGLADISGDTAAKYTLKSSSKVSDEEYVKVLDASGSELLSLRAIMDDNNDWKVDMSSVCIENFQIAVPADSTVTFNSIPVDAKYVTGTYGDYDMQSVITLPIVTGQTVTVDVVTSLGTLSSEVLPVISDTPLDLTAIPMALTDADVPLAVLTACYQTSYEKSATTGKVPAADIAAYFSPNSKPSVLADVSNNITDQTDVSLSALTPTKITIETNSIIAIDFSCVYNFEWFGTALEHELETTILMEKQADGTYLIYNVPDLNFFLEPIFSLY